jgi:type IV secretory pathway TraG/TraD family ATPase VirD4
VVLDIKGELFRLTAGIRGETGDGVFALDSQGPSSRWGTPCSLLAHGRNLLVPVGVEGRASSALVDARPPPQPSA